MVERTAVEAHVRRLWRHRGVAPPAPRRGPRQQLDLDDVLDAAVAVADAEGLDRFSTRAVAAGLGVSAMGLYPYVGSKDQMVALMQDHVSALPAWTDPGTSLAADLEAWARRLFDLYLDHPWLTAVPWAAATGGPNEQDWLERLLAVLDRWDAPSPSRAAVVTALYATVRATAQTAAPYRHLAGSGGAEAWWERTTTTYRLVDDYAVRYPHSVRLEPHDAQDWQEAPWASVRHVVAVTCRGLGR